MKKYICSLLMALLCVCYANAQTTVTGVVKDEKGETLPGASVYIKGTNNGVVTDVNGAFSLKVSDPETDILKITFVGMDEQEFALKGRTSGIVINLSANVKLIDEVVVVGYGTMKRKDLTGAVSSLSNNTIKDLPVSTIDEALTGRLAGVVVQTTDGSPDADITIRVRGGGSITQDNSPLFIVDGFKVPSISNISPRDIQSIDVLKDAAATAIYGAEGANGVLIITTKSAEKGKVTVNFNTYYGVKKPYNLPRPLSPYEYVYYQKELDPTTDAGWFSLYGVWDDIDIYKSQLGEDWVNKLFNTPTEQKNYNLSITGGSDNVKVSLSLTRDDQGYIMKTSNSRRDNASLKINWKVSDFVSADFSTRLSNTIIDGPAVASGKLLLNCVRYASALTLTQVNEQNLVNQDELDLETLGNINNPLASIAHDYKKQDKFENSYNAGVSIKLFKALTYRFQGSYTYKKNHTDEIWTKNTGKSVSNGGLPVADRDDINGNYWTIQNTLSYNKNFAKVHHVDVVIGQEANSNQDKEIFIESKYYPADMTASEILAMWNYGTSEPTYTTINEPTRTASYFGRVNYQLMDRYMFTATTRIDGKNVFAPGKRWGIFPGFAAAWRISDEPFFNNKTIISNLKLRASYGRVGNARVSSYWRKEWSFVSESSDLSYPDGDATSAMELGNIMSNSNLKWESKISRNLGLDFGLFNDKLNGTVEFYSESTDNLILKMPIPASSGYTYQYQNVGKTTNRGIEITLTGNIIKSQNFLLTGSFNIAFNKNVVDKYTSSYSTLTAVSNSLGSEDFIVQEGKPLGQFYGYVCDGAYSFDDFYYSPTDKNWVLYDGLVSDKALLSNNFGPGHIKLKDLDGDKVITSADRTVIGNAQPKHTGGFGLNARWKMFDLSALFNWTYGNKVFNVNKMMFNTYTGSKKYQNITEAFSLSKRFTTIDPETGLNIFSGTYANPDRLKEINKNATIWSPLINATFPMSWEVEDGSFLRMSSLTLGFTFPQGISRKVKISNLRFYGTLYNVFCLTKYSGQDPEVSVNSSNPLTPGVDYSAYPKARNLVIGANLTF